MEMWNYLWRVERLKMGIYRQTYFPRFAKANIIQTAAVGGITADASIALDDMILAALANNSIDAVGSSVLANITVDGNSNAAINAAGDVALNDQSVDANANAGMNAVGSAVLADVAADGNSNAVINAAGDVALNDQSVDANANAGINAVGATSLSDETVDANSNLTIGAAADKTLDEIIVSADIDNAIIAEAQKILDDASAVGQITVTTPAIIAVISDLALTGHPVDVRTALIAGAGGLLTIDNVAIRNGGFSADIEYARSVGAQMVIRSISDMTSCIANALEYYKNYGIQSFMPAGSNSPGEVFESNGGTNLPNIIVTGAGDIHNETADDIEFFAPDPITFEPDRSSYSNGFIAGQMYAIKTMRNCSWWEARSAARMTASGGGVWDEVDGYGLIDVNAAIVFSGSIPEDPYMGIERIITAMLELAEFILAATIGSQLQSNIIFGGKQRATIFSGDKKKYVFKNRTKNSIGQKIK
jgi:hypothetical protein